eukprot:m.19374 g.19374  ORF g.19374 m.19374 type:complete len:93 (-) comp30985_c0_seq1:69-347(-)
MAQRDLLDLSSDDAQEQQPDQVEVQQPPALPAETVELYQPILTLLNTLRRNVRALSAAHSQVLAHNAELVAFCDSISQEHDVSTEAALKKLS